MKPSALKREHPAIQNMKFLKKILLLWVIFALIDPDRDSEYGSGATDLIESGSETLLANWFTMLFRPQVSHAGVL
jgi:hypothetical protein